MPKHTEPVPLDLGNAPTLRYHPLSGFGAADYVEHYFATLESTGAFDALKYSTAELSLTADKLDLAGLASLGSAAAAWLGRAVGETKNLRALIVDHCTRFKVQVYDETTGQWVDLNTVDIIDEHLDFGQMLDTVRALAGGVLRPLWSRLRSSVVAKRNESRPPSTSATLES